MKRTTIFSLFVLPVLLLGIDGGFGDEYYKLDIAQKRKVFITKLNEMLGKSFVEIQKEREFALNFLDEGAKTGYRNLDQEKLSRLTQIQQKYRIKELFDRKSYEDKIDVIPKSMGIAQAIVESGTGTSRFTREANNLFGQWTFSGRGLVPKKRQAGKTHKVKIFDNLQQSVDAYVLNLNSHASYKQFRALRAKYRSQNKQLTGLEAIHTMVNYSAIKEKYVEILRSVIVKNNLSRFDGGENLGF